MQCIDSDLLLPRNLMRLIMSKCTQWGRLELRIPQHDFEEFNTVSGPFPLLQCHAMDIVDYAFPVTWNTGLYLRAPNLLTLRFGRALCGDFLTDSDGGSASLRPFEFWPHYSGLVMNCVRIFARLPHTCHLLIRGFHGNLSINPVAISAPPLTTLILRDDLEFLNCVQIPTLRHLDVPIFEGNFIPYIMSFLFRSACILTRFTLRIMDSYPDAWWLTCLASAPEVVYFELISNTERYHLFHHEDILPRLERVRFINIIGAYLEFLRLLRTRRVFHRVELDVPDLSNAGVHPTPEVLAGFSALAAKGMQIKIQAFGYK
ncbi:hypothetical protein C8R44DRAFT_870696 [Mycena epipterygia]|nr:hypothetical protein C8R44DRAFT_870696 [Mycena epipterygia]